MESSTLHRFQENALKVSNLMHDELVPGKKIAAYWVEYILRHGGTKHLETTSKNMPFYQIHLLDVFLLLAATVSTFLLVNYALVSYVWIFQGTHHI